MAYFFRVFLFLIFAGSMLCMQNALAVIVAGTSGTGNNNATQAGLDSYLASASQPDFPYWGNLIRVVDASGVYLGFNETTGRGWVMSANHVTTPTSISVAGNTYSVVSGTQIGTSDLKLYEIGGDGDPAMPLLPTVPLASGVPSIDDFTLMFGRGFTNATSSPYSWGTPGTNDANGMRWGTNTVELTAVVNGNLYIVVDFDGPGDPGATAFDAQGSLGDSGGGLFIFRNGYWELSGIAHFVDDGPDFLEPTNEQTGDGVVNPSEYGDFTAYTDVHSHQAAINGLTGNLIPEPSAMMLLVSGIALLMGRRREHG